MSYLLGAVWAVVGITGLIFDDLATIEFLLVLVLSAINFAVGDIVSAIKGQSK